MQASTATRTCPNCGQTIEVDQRFTPWCEHCEWNIDPGPAPKLDQRRARRALATKAAGESLFESLRASGVSRPGPSPLRFASLVIAVAIQAVSLFVLGFGFFLLITNFPDVFAFVAGVPLILAGILIRPRLGRVAPGTVLLPPAEAPALYALVNRVATEVKAKPVDLIATTPAFNASHGQVGYRRRRVLWIGLALWNVLSDEERVALLGHELAHQVNGDLSQGLIVGSALRSLSDWHAIFRSPRWNPGSGTMFGAVEAIGQLLARIATRAVRHVVGMLYDFEESLLYLSRQRAEYFADLLAAEVGSTSAALACLDVLHLARLCAMAVRYSAQRDEPDIWTSELAFFQQIGRKEWERIRRLDARRGTPIDATHPPTNLRVALLKGRPVEQGRVRVSAEESKKIRAEMVSAFDLVEQALKARLET
jgi:Zn-dependent protease with chaperone function